MKPKTQTFALGKYRLDIIDEDIKGLCDVPSEYDILRLMIPNGNTLKDLATIIHEASHAEGIPDKYLDGDRDFSIHVAKLLWRLGWRRK